VDVIAVSVDPPEISEKLRRRLDLPIRILSDANGTLMDPLNIRHDGGMPPGLIAGEVARINPSRDLFLSTNYLLDEQGVIRWIYRPDTYRMRASVDELLAAIDALGPRRAQRVS
jgi:peroxiredoxin